MNRLLVLVLLAGACARDARPPEPPRSADRTSTGEVPDLQVATKRYDELPPRDTGFVYVDPGSDQPQRVREAVAVLRPTSGSQVQGLVLFRETNDGLRVFTTVTGLPDGVHAYHVHVFGDCSAPDASSAGPHFHFTGSSFSKEEAEITGNLGEIFAAAGKSPTHQARIARATLQGGYSLIGRAVIIHARGNDPKHPPDGDAGDRLACGVIGIGNPQPPQAASR